MPFLEITKTVDHDANFKRRIAVHIHATSLAFLLVHTMPQRSCQYSKSVITLVDRYPLHKV